MACGPPRVFVRSGVKRYRPHKRSSCREGMECRAVSLGRKQIEDEDEKEHEEDWVRGRKRSRFGKTDFGPGNHKSRKAAIRAWSAPVREAGRAFELHKQPCEPLCRTRPLLRSRRMRCRANARLWKPPARSETHTAGFERPGPVAHKGATPCPSPFLCAVPGSYDFYSPVHARSRCQN